MEKRESNEGMNVQMDVFAPHKANLFIVMEDVSPASLNLGLGPAKSLVSSTIKKESLLTSVATLLTGTHDHLIVGDSCDLHGIQKRAYQDFFPEVLQIQDLVSKHTHRNGLIISGSSSEGLAKALATMSPSDSHIAMVWDNEEERFVSLHHQESLESVVFKISRDEVLADIRNHLDVSVLREDKIYNALYAELALMIRSALNVQRFDYSKDTYADMFLFGIHGLKEIQSQYGINSAEYTYALQLTEKTIQYLIKSLEHVYKEKLAYEIVYLPHVTYNDEPYCPNSMYAYHKTRQDEEPVDSNKTHGNYTIPEEIAEWHLFTWTWVGLLIILIFVVWALFSMDTNMDSNLLYPPK